jgi:hypothetical protein
MTRIAGSTKLFASGVAKMAEKPFWEKDAPEDAKKRHLDRKQVQAAKARARAAGRPYPNAVDNIAVSRKGK